MKKENEAITKGIFVQQVHKTLAWGQKPIGYCVTFPRLDDSGKTCLFPTQTFPIFSKALDTARAFKHSDSRLRGAPIYSLQESWRKGYRGTRLLQLVEL